MSCRRTRGQASANYRSARGRLFGWRNELQKIPHSAHNLYPGRQESDHAPPYTPNIKRFMTQLLATGLKHNTEAVFTSARFTVGSFEHRALPRLSLSHTQQAHARGPRNWSCFRVHLTPFTPFKSPFSSESRVKITLWLRLWSWGRTKKTLNVAASHLIAWLTYQSTVKRQIFIHKTEDVLYLKVKKKNDEN